MSVLLDVTWVPQTDGYSCGFIAAQIILSAYNVGFWKQALRDDLGLTREGLSLAQLRKGLYRYGVYFRKIKEDFWIVRRQINAGRPILVASKPNPNGSDHWSVIIGYDLPDRLAFRNHVVLKPWAKWHKWDILTNHLNQSTDQEDRGLFAAYCYEVEGPTRQKMQRY